MSAEATVGKPIRTTADNNRINFCTISFSVRSSSTLLKEMVSRYAFPEKRAVRAVFSKEFEVGRPIRFEN